jgi:hypothetical protein
MRLVRSLDAAGLNEGGQLHDLRFDAERRVIELRNRLLVEDDAAAIGMPEGATERSWFERLVPGRRLRKQLVVPDARAQAAQLVWCGREPDDNEVPLHVAINGVHVLRPATKHAHPQCRHYYTADWASSAFDNWFVMEIPVGALRDGSNDVELWVEDAYPGRESWELMVAADSERHRGSDPARDPVGRSARSDDGGETWHTGGLGQGDAIDGEYCLRMNVEQHARQGTLVSEVIDLTEGADGGIRSSMPTRLRVSLDAEAPSGTAVLRVRMGATPDPQGEGWTAWQELAEGAGDLTELPGTWLQAEVTLSTDDPRRSPSLHGLHLDVAGDEPVATAPSVRLQQLSSGRVTRPSEGFTWEDPTRLADLRERFELDRVVDGAATEFEAMLRLLHWSYRIPIGRLNPYAWRHDELPQLERDDAGQIRLEGPYDEPRRQGHCLYCNLTLIAALTSFGYPARWVNMSTKHTYGHEVTEVWSNDYDKWVFLDATRDYYMTDPDTGVPLSLAQIAGRVGEILPQPCTWDAPIHHLLPENASPIDGDAGNVRVRYRQPDHGGPVFVDGAMHDLTMIGHLQMVLRNDFASRPTPVPWRISSNWGSSEFVTWSSAAFPPKLEYQRSTDRPQDWEPPLNRVRLALTRTADPTCLQVDVDTVTPWFDGFEVTVDGESTRQDASCWMWHLHEGRNYLCVRAHNRMGVLGPPAEAVVTVSP